MRTAPYLAIAATLVLWASSFPAIKAGLDGYSPLPLAALRFAAASLVLGCSAPVLGIRLPQRRHSALVLALGLVGVAGYHILLNYGEASATASAAAFITNVAPLFTTIMAKATIGAAHDASAAKRREGKGELPKYERRR
jgi:drug/metabolite transporter (DMT)-like permease